MKQYEVVVKSICSLLVLLLLSAGPAVAQTITEIIDATGDGAGNLLDQPSSIAVDGSGNVYVVGSFTDNAFKITPDGVITEIINATGDGVGNLLDYPSGIAVDGLGNVYVAGFGTDNAFKITPGGIITEIIDATGDRAGNSLDKPYMGLAVDGSGNVYVTGRGTDNAFKITPGGVITEIIDATGDGTNTLDNPYGIAVDGSGNVYVAGQLSDNAFRITSGGVITEIIGASGDGTNTLDSNQGITVDGSGNVYVTGYLSDNAFRIPPADMITQIIDGTGDGTGNPLNGPIGIVVDSSDNVYTTGIGGNAFRITSDGVITEIIDTSGDGDGNLLQNPFSIAVDGSGNVYVAGAVSDNVFKIASAVPPPTNTPPVADAGGPYLVAVSHEIMLDGSDSYDPDEDILSYFWNQVEDLGDFDDDTLTSPSFTGVTAGITELELWVDDGVDIAPDSTMLVVYDPSGGFVTGGGWIDSPSGAYTPCNPDDADLTGKANFGFVSKYKKGATTPTGNTEFQFHAGDLNFHSSSYDWLVVNQGGTNAQFKGSGAINGIGDYKFMLWAGDGESDTFRIKIWADPDEENPVYDNGVAQAIGGGSIIVHTSKK